jgi:DNA polymerase-3 subunit beta
MSGLCLELKGDHLQVTGSDLELTISVRAAVSGERDGIAIVQAKLLTDIVRNLASGAVTFEIDDEEARISSGRSKFAVRTISAHEFPPPPKPADNSVVIDATLFSEALRQVVSAASTDESRQVLTGVLMAAEGDGLRLAATDSYRLAVRDLPGTVVMGEGQQVLVPSGALKELSRLLSTAETVTIRLGERDVTFEVDDARLTSRLIMGDFPPNYRALIPNTHPNCLTVGREPLLEALRRMRLIAKEAKDATPVRLVLKADGVELLVSSSELGQAREEIDASHQGEELTVAFNPDYLIDGLEVMPGDEVMLETIHPQKPALLRSIETPDFLYLLMPVRVAAAFLLLLTVSASVRAGSFAPSETIFPDTTRAWLSVPDPDAFRERFDRSSYGQLVADPAMKVFMDSIRTASMSPSSTAHLNVCAGV